MDKSLLLKAAPLPEADVELEGVGTVRVRALTRLEALGVGEQKVTVERERRLLVHGMVDPQMTYQDAKQWQEVAPTGHIEEVTTAIARLSGMLPEAPKEATERFPDGPEPEV